MLLRRPTIALFAIATVICGGRAAVADQLGKDACDALRTEQAGMVTAGIKTDMDKGPEWAKANMAPERLQQVARYIELEEQLSFRCRVLAVPARKKGSGGNSKAATVHVAPDSADGSGQKKPTAAPVPAAGTASPVTKPVIVRQKPASQPTVRRQASPATTKVRKPAQQKTGLFSVE